MLIIVTLIVILAGAQGDPKHLVAFTPCIRYDALTILNRCISWLQGVIQPTRNSRQIHEVFTTNPHLALAEEHGMSKNPLGIVELESPLGMNNLIIV